MSYRILTIDPGSTSTKIGVFDDEKMLFEENLHHSAEELAQFETIPQQEAFRRRLVLKALEEHHIPLESLSAVCGRGGVLKPVHGGTYLTTDAMIDTLKKGPYGHHASNLGGLLAREIGSALHIPSYIVDPPVVDELAPLARYSGHPLITRRSIFHALNQKSVGRKAARQLGKSYEEARLIVCHLGGGVSVAAHDHGRVVDVFNVKDEGAMGMDRGGGLPVNQLIDYCYAGRSREEVKRTLGRRSGMLSYVGTTDFREICARVVSGDERFTAAYRALVYQLAKDIGAMAAVLHFEVDAIVYTGGMAYEQFFCDDITAYVGRLAPVLRFPGEEEMQALAEGALRVLHGEAQAETY